ALALIAHAADERGKHVIALRADHEIDYACALKDLLSFSLRHAARHRDHGVEATGIPRLLYGAHPSKLGIDLLGGLLADVAGVEDDEVGLGRIVGRHVAMSAKRLPH